ncbi:MAG TPA: cytochrome c oxidase subunit 3 family protein [Labilithrix sp.]|nr:cytochrome c oxidase subunit 3 family protein [Labilithrix sp.]
MSSEATASADAHEHADGHGHHGPAWLAHHFDTPAQQFDAAKLGMWVFLAQELLFFSGLFVAYGVYRSWYPEMFVAASHQLDKIMGGTNTVVLLFSSFTAAMAVRSSQLGKKQATGNYLLITILCACVFLVIKYFEYSHKFHAGLLPGRFFHPHPDHLVPGSPPLPTNTGSFFSIYFMMTGVHGVHVIIGIGVMIWVWLRNQRGEFSKEFFTPVDLVALYWHLVDLVWIYLFPLLYLV